MASERFNTGRPLTVSPPSPCGQRTSVRGHSRRMVWFSAIASVSSYTKGAWRLPLYAITTPQKRIAAAGQGLRRSDDVRRGGMAVKWGRGRVGGSHRCGCSGWSGKRRKANRGTALDARTRAAALLSTPARHWDALAITGKGFRFGDVLGFQG